MRSILLIPFLVAGFQQLSTGQEVQGIEPNTCVSSLQESSYHSSDCQTIEEALSFFHLLQKKKNEYTVRAVDYEPILLGREKSILKIKVDQGILPDSILYNNSAIQMLDNGMGYDEFEGDSIYTSVDSILTHQFKDDISWRPNFVRRLYLFENGNRHIEECQFVNYSITEENYTNIDDLEIKKVNDSIYYNDYVINLVTKKNNSDDNFSPQSSMPDLFQNWSLTYDVFTNSGYYVESLFPQTFKDNFQGRYAGSTSFGFTRMNANLNRGTWDHELNHMIVNSWSTRLFSEDGYLSRGHWKGLEAKSSGFGSQCYNGVHDSIYYENQDVVFYNPDNVSRLAVNDIEKVLWGILDIDSVSYPIKITKNYDNNTCTADSIILIDKDRFRSILDAYIAGRTQGYDEKIIPTIFIVLSNSQLSKVGMNVVADAVKRRERYLKETYFGKNLELDYTIRGDANMYFQDNDGDGFYTDIDCDDDDPSINPDAQEQPYNNFDDDCNPLTLDDDLDQDGFLLADDCNDEDPSINPDAVEIPNNGIDEDCDGSDLMSSTHTIGDVVVEIYPNPVSDNLFIDISEKMKFLVQIISMGGEIIHQAQDQTKINVSDFAAGSYLLKIRKQGTEEQVVEKIVIN